MLFLAGGVITGVRAGVPFKGVAAIAPPKRRAGEFAGMVPAGDVGLSMPVVGLEVTTQYLSPRLTLLIFTAVLVARIVLMAPRLLADSDDGPAT